MQGCNVGSGKKIAGRFTHWKPATRVRESDRLEGSPIGNRRSLFRVYLTLLLEKSIRKFLINTSGLMGLSIFTNSHTSIASVSKLMLFDVCM